jgi:preprotein translocase subunit SecG
LTHFATTATLKRLIRPNFTSEFRVYYLLLAVMILNGFFLGVIVLLQSGKGGGLASMGGGSSTDSVIGGRQAATLLTKATWASGGLFLALALTLSILSTRRETPQPILREEFRQGTAPPPRQVLPGTQPAQGANPAATPQAPPPTTTTR